MSKLMNKCKICGKNAYSEYCWKHKFNKSLHKKKSFKFEKQEIDIESINQMHDFFFSIWKKKKHVSDLNGEILISPICSAYYHHILPRRKFPEAKFDEENIVQLSINQHANVELNPYRYEQINNQRNYLLKKYNVI
jgi:hypothetical protein